MYQLINETGSFSSYDVPKGKPHWWERVVTEPNLQEFYKKILANPQIPTLNQSGHYEMVVADPGEMSGRYGILVTYLQEQGKLGKLKVSPSERKDVWRFTPENIMAFEIQPDSEIKSLVIDGANNNASVFTRSASNTRTLKFWLHPETKSWTMTDPAVPPTRSNLHFGGLNAILRSTGPYLIRCTSDDLLPLAIQTSRNLNTYFGAESEILTMSDLNDPAYSSEDWPLTFLVTLAIGGALPPHPTHPFRFTTTLERQSGKGWQPMVQANEPHAAIYLRPNAVHDLELVIWGSNLAMAEMAARLMPMVSGTGQPDWIVCRKEIAWKGLDGCEVGWFDAWWKIQGT